MQNFDFKKYLWITAFLLFSNIAFANDSKLSILPQLIDDAKQNNPQIKAAHNRLLAAKYMIPQARSLPDPKFNVGYTNMNGNPEMAQNPQSEQMIGASQEIPFPGKLVVKNKIATLDEKQAKAEYQSISLSVIAQLKRFFYDLYFIDQSTLIILKNKILLEKMEKSTEVNYSVGKIPQQDIFRAQTEVSRASMKLIELKQERLSMQADINRLLNRRLDTFVKTPHSLSLTFLTMPLTHFYSLLESQSPQLKVQQRNVQKGEQGVRLSKMDYLPDVDIGASDLHDTDMHTHGYQIMFSASIPLYFLEKQNNGVHESVSRYEANLNDFSSMQRDLLFQLKNAYLQSRRSEQLIQLLKQAIIPQAKSTFLSGQSTYSVGRVDFLTLLNSLLLLQENELDLQKEKVQHEKAITVLDEITGTNV